MANPTEAADILCLNVFLAKFIFGIVICVSFVSFWECISFLISVTNLTGYLLVALLCNGRLLVDYLFNIQTDCFIVQDHLSQRIVAIPFSVLLAWALTGTLQTSLTQVILYAVLIFSTLNLRYVVSENLTPSVTVEMSEAQMVIQSQQKSRQQIDVKL